MVAPLSLNSYHKISPSSDEIISLASSSAEASPSLHEESNTSSSHRLQQQLNFQRPFKLQKLGFAKSSTSDKLVSKPKADPSIKSTPKTRRKSKLGGRPSETLVLGSDRVSFPIKEEGEELPVVDRASGSISQTDEVSSRSESQEGRKVVVITAIDEAVSSITEAADSLVHAASSLASVAVSESHPTKVAEEVTEAMVATAVAAEEEDEELTYESSYADPTLSTEEAPALAVESDADEAEAELNKDTDNNSNNNIEEDLFLTYGSSSSSAMNDPVAASDSVYQPEDDEDDGDDEEEESLANIAAANTSVDPLPSGPITIESSSLSTTAVIEGSIEEPSSVSISAAAEEVDPEQPLSMTADLPPLSSAPLQQPIRMKIASSEPILPNPWVVVKYKLASSSSSSSAVTDEESASADMKYFLNICTTSSEFFPQYLSSSSHDNDHDDRHDYFYMSAILPTNDRSDKLSMVIDVCIHRNLATRYENQAIDDFLDEYEDYFFHILHHKYSISPKLDKQTRKLPKIKGNYKSKQENSRQVDIIEISEIEEDFMIQNQIFATLRRENNGVSLRKDNGLKESFAHEESFSDQENGKSDLPMQDRGRFTIHSSVEPLYVPSMHISTPDLPFTAESNQNLIPKERLPSLLGANEKLLYTSLVGKRSPYGFIQNRILALTNAPSLLYLEPKSLDLRGEIALVSGSGSQRRIATLKEVNPNIFEVHTVDRVYRFTDKVSKDNTSSAC
jgi:hypothetical protein